jgi:hypothetical protein
MNARRQQKRSGEKFFMERRRNVKGEFNIING